LRPATLPERDGDLPSSAKVLGGGLRTALRWKSQFMTFRRSLLAVAALALGTVSLAGCGSSGSTSSSSKPTIIIGSAAFEEQQIVANMYGDVLAHAGYPVKVEQPLGTRAVVVPALQHNQISLEPDYAASLLGYLHGGTPQAAGSQITTAIAADNAALSSSGVTVLGASKALDTNVFVVTRATASKDHLTTISSLAPYASSMTLGGPPECPTFAGCQPGLIKVYGLNFASFKSLDEAGPLSVAALKNGEVQVVELFSSDGNVLSNNFVALIDNKHLEGADYIVPVIRTSVATQAVTAALNNLDAKLTTAAISQLNIQVNVDKKQPAAVAQAWLKSQNLI
jgi:osmoprotectant transport system substrate-binding protein